MTDNIALAPAYVLSREIAARRLSPVDLMDALLARIATHNPKLHAFVEVYEPEARLAAEAADKAIRSGHAVGPWHGIPVGIKDIIDIEGRITTGGSASRLDHRATATATVVRRLVSQGMIVLGKTHTVEFACGAWGMNQHRGTPWNPWDAEVPRTPGGSSSGSGVAVAARLAPWALGTDTGCSIRQPAAWCGITGLKTSMGRISTNGILPLSPTLDTPGPMARTVRDVALLFDLLQGPDPLDPRTRGHLPADPLSTLEHGVRGLRLARLPSEERAGVAADVLDAYDRSLTVLSGLGAEIVDIALPFSLVEFISMTSITMAEAYFTHSHVVEDPRQPLDEVVRSRILAASRISAQDYLATLQRRDQMKQAMKTAMAGVDAFLTPTAETAAIPLNEVDQNGQPTRLTRFVNLLDMCALSLPNGFTAERLPSSLQIVCREYEESLALRIGQAYQQATDWHERMPPAVGQ
ncbi:amidase [Paraburkholderia fungorum]|uniref:amidase n=1 Tax=Paraburkholderia fungorum TaxID=134537 RepID=UPI0038BB82C7